MKKSLTFFNAKIILTIIIGVLGLFSSLSAIGDDMANSKTVNICAFMRPIDGKADELRNALLSLTKPTHSEEGYLIYNIYEESSGAFFLHEVWRSQQDLDRHLQKVYIQDFINKSINLIEGKNDAYFGKVIFTAEKTVSNTQNSQDISNISAGSVIHPKEGQADVLRSVLLSLAPLLQEGGNTIYNIYQQADGTFFTFETWHSQKDFDISRQNPQIQNLSNEINRLSDRNEIHFGKLISH